MPAANVMNPVRAINGSYGELYEVRSDGQGGENQIFLANINTLEGRITVDRLDVNRSGTRRRGYKRGNITIEGTISGFKVTSAFLDRFANEANTEIAPNALLLEYRLDDPEALGTEIVRLKGVQLWEVNFGFSAGDLVEESIPFTAEDVEPTQTVSGVFTLL